MSREDIVTTSLRVPKADLDGFQRVCDEIGIPMAMAIRIFMRATIRRQGLPFAVSISPPAKAGAGEASQKPKAEV